MLLRQPARWPLLLLTLCCGACGAQCPGGHSTVSAVLDGDTVILADQRTVRLVSIDAPEIGSSTPECGAIPARDALQSLVLGRRVDVRPNAGDCSDRYGRSLARLRIDGTDVGAELLRRGLACTWPDSDAAPADYAEAEMHARTVRAGNWAHCPRFCIAP